MITLIDRNNDVLGKFLPDTDCRVFDMLEPLGHAYGRFEADEERHPAIEMMVRFKGAYDVGDYSRARMVLAELESLGIRGLDAERESFNLDIVYASPEKMAFFVSRQRKSE